MQSAVERVATVAQLDLFDEVVDVRSPAEFADDHVPGAINCPVLDDDERARVGTLYKQVSPFEAKRVGAVLVARNIARHIETRFAERPRNWRPLVYCWRGGTRSDAMCDILRRVGWRAVQLEGGYRAWRRTVLDALATLPIGLDLRVVCGRTGSGKSLLLAALARAGAQVLDLEAIAHHRGSVLGALPCAPQPTQKLFESTLWLALSRLDRARPVWVESESRKIGNLQVPGPLVEGMRAATCLRLDTDDRSRVELLRRDYAHLTRDAETLCRRLSGLATHHGRETIERWHALARASDDATLVAELLARHYDPAYDRSMARNYAQLALARSVSLTGTDTAAFDALAREVLRAPR